MRASPPDVDVDADLVDVGLVSDTHGLLRPGVLQLLEGCWRPWER